MRLVDLVHQRELAAPPAPRAGTPSGRPSSRGSCSAPSLGDKPRPLPAGTASPKHSGTRLADLEPRRPADPAADDRRCRRRSRG